MTCSSTRLRMLARRQPESPGGGRRARLPSVPNSPRVSVLLPVRDAQPFLEHCLASLAAQTLERFEVVAIDDGSTDGSSEVLAAAVTGNVRIHGLSVHPTFSMASTSCTALSKKKAM